MKHTCRICEALAKMPKEDNCKHTLPLQSGYGFGRVSGWLGIGITYRCPDCATTLWFEDDSAEMHPEEKEHNDAMRAERAQWGNAVKEGQYE